jgi:geranylgeranyl diphosphate synthase type 3
MIDDIEDNSKLRRGIPVAHSIFGIPTVINGANYAYFLALEKCHALKNPEAMNVFVGELLNLHRGQGHDILVRHLLVLSSHIGNEFSIG